MKILCSSVFHMLVTEFFFWMVDCFVKYKNSIEVNCFCPQAVGHYDRQTVLTFCRQNNESTDESLKKIG